MFKAFLSLFQAQSETVNGGKYLPPIRALLLYCASAKKGTPYHSLLTSVSDREGKEQRGGGGCVGASFLSEEHFLFQVLRHFNLDMTDITH